MSSQLIGLKNILCLLLLMSLNGNIFEFICSISKLLPTLIKSY